jgi:death on curing protein
VSWVWIAHDVVLAIHDWQIAEHGGDEGVRDGGLLASALQRPRNASAYEDCTVYELAAYYAAGIIQNHPFVDGNKRVGFVLLELFLNLNGHDLTASDADCYGYISAFARGDIELRDLAEWIEANST